MTRHEYGRIPYYPAGSGRTGLLEVAADNDRVELALSAPDAESSVLVLNGIAAAELIAILRHASTGVPPEADGSFDDLEAIKALPPFRAITCSGCGMLLEVHALTVYATCPSCRTEHKCRAFGGIGTEIQDVIDAVLQWAHVSPAEVRERQVAKGGRAQEAV